MADNKKKTVREEKLALSNSLVLAAIAEMRAARSIIVDKTWCTGRHPAYSGRDRQKLLHRLAKVAFCVSLSETV